jgi:hypothetical protein
LCKCEEKICGAQQLCWDAVCLSVSRRWCFALAFALIHPRIHEPSLAADDNAMKANDDTGQRDEVKVELIAVVAAVVASHPVVLTISHGSALPSGPFELGHRSLQAGLRDWVEQQTGHPLGYIEQLYTFADGDRVADQQARRAISISYLGLTRDERTEIQPKRDWRSWYNYFPWEDRGAGESPLVADIILASPEGLS